jgi:hypothetical protein
MRTDAEATKSKHVVGDLSDQKIARKRQILPEAKTEARPALRAEVPTRVGNTVEVELSGRKHQTRSGSPRCEPPILRIPKNRGQREQIVAKAPRWESPMLHIPKKRGQRQQIISKVPHCGSPMLHIPKKRGQQQQKTRCETPRGEPPVLQIPKKQGHQQTDGLDFLEAGRQVALAVGHGGQMAENVRNQLQEGLARMTKNKNKPKPVVVRLTPLQPIEPRAIAPIGMSAMERLRRRVHRAEEMQQLSPEEIERQERLQRSVEYREAMMGVWRRKHEALAEARTWKTMVNEAKRERGEEVEEDDAEDEEENAGPGFCSAPDFCDENWVCICNGYPARADPVDRRTCQTSNMNAYLEVRNPRIRPMMGMRV